MYLISWSLARQYFTEFYFAISIGKYVKLCKKGIKFRDSSVFDFILLFKKSELLKISRQGTCNNLYSIHEIFANSHFFTTEGTKWNFLVKSFKFLGTSCTLLLLRVDYFISVIWIFCMGLTLLLRFFYNNSKNAKVKTREIKYQQGRCCCKSLKSNWSKGTCWSELLSKHY